MGRRNVQWILEEIPKLVAQGVLAPDGAERLKAHYEALPRKSGLSLAILLFAILGAILIGLGVMLTIGSNWEQLGRPARTVLSFAPLVVAQTLAVVAICRRWESRPWREASSTLVFLAIGSSIALIGQTYNLPDDPVAFLMTWALLGAPLVYLLDAILPLMLYAACVVGWTTAAQSEGNQASWFWPLFALMLPYAIRETKVNRRGARSVIAGWVLCTTLCIGTGVSLEKVLPGLWIIIYGCLFASLYLAGRFWLDAEAGVWRRPYYAVGAGGIGIMSIMLSFTWPWDAIGWRFMRYGQGYIPEAGIVDYIVLACFSVAVVTMLVISVRRGHASAIPYGLFPLLATGGYVLAAFDLNPSMPASLFTVYLLALGLYTTVAGLRIERLEIVSGGMFLLAALIVARFFDQDLPMVFRGIAFIVLGLTFLAVNIVLLKRGASRTGAAQ